MGWAPRRVLPFAEHQDEFIAAFRPYVADVMRRFGARLPAIEVWNEPNLPGIWNLPNPTNYLAVLKAAHDEIKTANTNALVCLGGVSEGMIICAENPDGSLAMVHAADDAQPGAAIS